MKTTARFEVQRRKALESLFTKKRLTELWRKLVRAQLRDLEVRDLHDYYDFNYAIEARVTTIIERVLSGQYRAEAPVIYRSEKKFGVCRHMLIPSPGDALVFQVLADALYEDIKKAQPWKGAYYSRDRHRLALPHEDKEAKSYPWFVLWPKFQQEIWDFSKAHKFLVTTDLANYYDNIALRELRHVIAAITKADEVYLDLLFSLIEDLSWSPDYLPPSHKGLPTINIEAPRLLAHALLFEVDEVLKERTKNSFVRWMDDINFGVDDRRAANVVLGQVNDVLKSRGLALNLAKTCIYSAREVRYHFLFRENVRLSGLLRYARRLKNIAAKHRLARRLAKELAAHVANSDARNREKVTKRYLTLLSALARPVGVETAVALFKNEPALRPNVLNYLARLPFSATAAKAFVSLLKPSELLDDITVVSIVDALIAWDLPRNPQGSRFVLQVGRRLSKPRTAFEWLARLRFLSKYGGPKDVLKTAMTGRLFDARDVFFTRQAIASLPRALAGSGPDVQKKWRDELTHGATDSAAVASNLLQLWDGGFPAKKHRLYSYLFPDKPQQPYPLPKFLLLCLLAARERSDSSTTPRPEVPKHVLDDWYRHWLKQLQPAWFH